MSLIANAIKHMKATGNIQEAVEIALGRKKMTEAELQATQQTQTWFCPNENAVNQLVLFVQNKLGIRVSDIKDYTNGSQGGYSVTFSGEMQDHDLASLASRFGCYPLAGAHQPGGVAAGQ